MQGNLKRIIAGIIAAAIIAPIGISTVSGDTEAEKPTDSESASETEEKSDDEEDDESYTPRSEKEVLSSMTLVSENESLALYTANQEIEDAEELFALVNKKNGFVWWSSPINAFGDENATTTIKAELASNLTIVYGEPAKRTTSTMRSNKNAPKRTYKEIENGVRITYRFSATKIAIPVDYVLEEDHLSVKIVTSDIKEEDDTKLLLSVSLNPAMGAADNTEEGSFAIPDGSGAYINFNNGKTSVKSYSAKVYGSDITAVSNTKPPVTEQIYLPMYGIIKGGENALVVVAHSGDTSASIEASVSGQSKSSYNTCRFSFTLRETDTFYMGTSATPLTIFQKGEIKTDEVEVKYYPVSGKNIDYVDVAAAYRGYLMTQRGIESKTSEDKFGFYLDLYGGTKKQKNVAGIPVKMKTSITSYAQAKEIAEKLIELGVDDMVLTYNLWTDAGMEKKADYKAKPSSVLGGKKEFNALKTYLEENNVAFYPSVSNTTFVSGEGFNTFADTAVRASGAYSKQLTYDLAFGVQNKLYDPMSLLSPEAFTEIYDKMAESYSKSGLSGASIGDMTSLLYGSYDKDTISRDNAKNIITDSLAKLKMQVGSVLAQGANAYAFEYVDHITDVPLSSSGFDIFDGDIPLFQLVMHGLIPYSSTAINGAPDSERALLMAAATGSAPSFDMLYEETNVLKDTELDVYYYANYEHMTDTAAGGYRFLRDVLGGVSDCFITDYSRDESVISAEYSNGTAVEVDLEAAEVSVNGKIYRLSDYVNEGGLISDGR